MSNKENKEKKQKIKMTEGKKICSVGGQALMEGIMMLGPHGMAQVVREPSGELNIKTEKITPLVRKNKFFGLPLVRGCVTLVDSMRRGMKALFDSAEISVSEDDPDYQPSKFDKWVEDKLGDKAAYLRARMIDMDIDLLEDVDALSDDKLERKLRSLCSN